jgi:hypothetical protein
MCSRRWQGASFTAGGSERSSESREAGQRDWESSSCSFAHGCGANAEDRASAAALRQSILREQNARTSWSVISAFDFPRASQNKISSSRAISFRQASRCLQGYVLRIKSSLFVRQLFNNQVDYVTRRFNASSAGLKGSWGCTFAETPLSAISRSQQI